MPPPDTSKSLLERARDPGDSVSWRKLVDLYSPLIRRWVRPHVAQTADVDDVVQEVLTALSSGLGTFQHNEAPGAFRAWLRAITVNRLRAHWRQKGRGSGDPAVHEQLDRLEDPQSELARAWDVEHDRHVAEALLESIRLEFQPATWHAFEGVVRDGRPPGEVAASLGLTVNAVLIAKSRVLKRLRHKAEHLID